MTDRPGPLVLVVDDDQQICRLLERTLASAGFAAETFSTGESALDRVRSGEADLVLLDLKPDQSGLDVLESVRADPATRLRRGRAPGLRIHRGGTTLTRPHRAGRAIA